MGNSMKRKRQLEQLAAQRVAIVDGDALDDVARVQFLEVLEDGGGEGERDQPVGDADEGLRGEVVQERLDEIAAPALGGRGEADQQDGQDEGPEIPAVVAKDAVGRAAERGLVRVRHHPCPYASFISRRRDR
jgi:hypothetical protein